MNMKNVPNGPEWVTARQNQISCSLTAESHVEAVDLNHVIAEYFQINFV